MLAADDKPALLPASPTIRAIYDTNRQRLADAEEKVAKESPHASRADVAGYRHIVEEMEKAYALGRPPETKPAVAGQ